MVKEYTHSTSSTGIYIDRRITISRGIETDRRQLDGGLVIAEKVLKYYGIDLLAIQKFDFGTMKSYVVIPGFVDSLRIKKGEHGLDISIISEIPVESMDDITKFVKEERLEGETIFW